VYGIEASIDEIEVRSAPLRRCSRRKPRSRFHVPLCGVLTRRLRIAQHHGSTDLLVTLAVMQYKGAPIAAQLMPARLLPPAVCSAAV